MGLATDYQALASSEAHPGEELNNQWLAHNYAPVRKTWDQTRCVVLKGSVPDGLLGGQYIRNGPNPKWEQNGRPYHWFDGDGMLHGVYFGPEGPTYVNRFIVTQKLSLEQELGGPVIPPIGLSLSNKFTTVMRGVVGGLMAKLMYKKSSGSNTALTYHNRRLLTLLEAEPPVHVTAPELKTVGQYRFAGDALGQRKGGVPHTDLRSSDVPGREIVTAHPKVCPKTGNMYFFGYNFQKKPYVCYSASDPMGKLFINTKAVPECSRPIMMHDIQITEHYAVLMDLPLIFNPSVNMKQGKPPIAYDETQPSRFHLLPRETGSPAAYTFETGPCMIFHAGVAFESANGEEVKLIGCRSGDPNLMRTESVLDSDSYLTEFTFHLSSGKTTQRRLSHIPGEFPVINNRYVASNRCRYVYYSRTAPSFNGTIFEGLVKVDMMTGEVKMFEFPPGLYHGEAAFAPASDDVNADIPEDAGYLITFVSRNTAEPTNLGQLWIIDARTMEMACVLEMPARVPYGFHGFWLGKGALDAQTRQVEQKPLEPVGWKDWAIAKALQYITGA